MTGRTIDISNIFLMLFSCVLAYFVPFELFLFSYAVLGPLHYLTEITWLHKRDYFSSGKYDYIWLVVLCIGLFLLNTVITGYPTMATFMTYLAFTSALGFILFRQAMWKIFFIMIAAFIGGLIITSPSFTLPFIFFFAIFLPTLVHVFVFTGLFILQGALKNRSTTGIISIIVFICCGAVFFIWKPIFGFYTMSDYARNVYVANGNAFAPVNSAFIYVFNMAQIHLFDLGKASMETLFQSKVGLSVGRFVAFAYTYHYLNWFSKTEVIKWHKVPKKWLATVIVMWIISVALYAYDFRVGLVVLLFLSFLHVFLEFPLNYRSMIGIGHEIKALTGSGQAQPIAVVKKRPSKA